MVGTIFRMSAPPSSSVGSFHGAIWFRGSMLPPIVALNSDKAWLPFGASPTLKGLTMDARFLRDEAARFRGMADTADREATKLRFLAMAFDYDARANFADEMTKSGPDDANNETTEPNLDEAAKASTAPELGEALTVKPGPRIAREPKETAVVVRRPVGRPRRE